MHVQGHLVTLFRALLAALSRSGMRAAADELLAWEALMDSLVVRYWLITCPASVPTYASIVGMCARVGSVPAPFLAQRCYAFMEILCPLLFFNLYLLACLLSRLAI